MFGGFFYVFENCQVSVCKSRVLGVVTELSIFSYNYGTAVWRELAGNYVKEGRLSRTVVAEDSYFLAFCKDVGEV